MCGTDRLQPPIPASCEQFSILTPADARSRLASQRTSTVNLGASKRESTSQTMDLTAAWLAAPPEDCPLLGDAPPSLARGSIALEDLEDLFKTRPAADGVQSMSCREASAAELAPHDDQRMRRVQSSSSSDLAYGGRRRSSLSSNAESRKLQIEQLRAQLSQGMTNFFRKGASAAPPGEEADTSKSFFVHRLLDPSERGREGSREALKAGDRIVVSEAFRSNNKDDKRMLEPGEAGYVTKFSKLGSALVRFDGSSPAGEWVRKAEFGKLTKAPAIISSGSSSCSRSPRSSPERRPLTSEQQRQSPWTEEDDDESGIAHWLGSLVAWAQSPSAEDQETSPPPPAAAAARPPRSTGGAEEDSSWWPSALNGLPGCVCLRSNPRELNRLERLRLDIRLEESVPR